MWLFARFSCGPEGGEPVPADALLWWPGRPRSFVVESTDGLPAAPPYFVHVMTFRRGRRRKVVEHGTLLN